MHFPTIERKIEQVTFGDKRYVLKQADGYAAATHRNRAAACATYQGKGEDIGLSKVHGVGDIEPALVQSCLFEVYDFKGQDKERPASTEFVKSLPPDIITALFDKIKEMTPGIDGGERDTEELVLKQISKLQKKLSKLRGEDEDPVPNSSRSMVNGSVLVES